MPEPLVMFGPDGETIVPFPVLRQKVNADLAQLAARKKKRTQKQMEAEDAMCDKEALGGLFGEAYNPHNPVNDVLLRSDEQIREEMRDGDSTQ